MSYTPTTWHGGDVLSAEAMNKIEQGIADGSEGFIVEVSDNNNAYILNKTYNEIKTAFLNGKSIIIFYYNSEVTIYTVVTALLEHDSYEVYTSEMSFYTENINDYPSTLDSSSIDQPEEVS